MDQWLRCQQIAERKEDAVRSISSINMGGPMENTAYLRRQALFYLRLSHLCLDPPLAAHLRFKAAESHEKALRAEFEAELDPDVRGEGGMTTGGLTAGG
jgi:hypothetical protein